MHALHFREQLPESTASEFDALVAKLKAFLLLEHNEDGSHRLFLNKVTASPNDTLGTNLLEDEGHWWRKGPWRLDDPRATDKHIVGLRPPDPPAGTINNYAPDGIDTAVLVEIEPLGDITLTGLKAPIGREKRLMILRNRDSGNTITLTHDSASSLEPNRFNLPESEDLEIGPGQAAWLYYDPARTAYTLIVTSHQAGGTGTIVVPEPGGDDRRLMESWITSGGSVGDVGFTTIFIGANNSALTNKPDTQYMSLGTAGAVPSHAHWRPTVQVTELRYGELTWRGRVGTYAGDQSAHRVWAGIVDWQDAGFSTGNPPNSNTIAAQCVAFRYNKTSAASAVDVNWYIVSSDGTTQTEADTGVAVIGGAAVTPNPYKLYIHVDTSYNITWSITNVTTGVTTTGSTTWAGTPSTTVRMSPYISLTEAAAGVKLFSIARMSLLTH